MRHLTPINEFFFNDDLKYYRQLAKQFDLAYRKTGERALILGPKNGHEISVSIGADSCQVRPSYYGSYYEPAKLVKSLDEYLKSFDFQSKPNVPHKFNHKGK